MKIKLKHVLYATIPIALICVLVIFLLTNVPNPTSKYDNFAKCLTEKDVVMYGAYWCPHCTNQKNIFGESFKYVNYVECDARGENARPELCEQENIQSIPAWVIDGKQYVGEHSLQELGVLTGCVLPEGE